MFRLIAEIPLPSWSQYGILGLVIIGLSGWIIKMEKDRKEAQESWRKTLKEVSDENTKAIKVVAEEHIKAIEEITDKHDAIIDKVSGRMDNTQKETNSALREHSTILTRLTILFENKKWN